MEEGLHVRVCSLRFCQRIERAHRRSDYRGLKKRINAIRREQQGLAVVEVSSGEDPLLPDGPLIPEASDYSAASPRPEAHDELAEDTDAEDDRASKVTTELDAADAEIAREQAPGRHRANGNGIEPLEGMERAASADGHELAHERTRQHEEPLPMPAHAPTPPAAVHVEQTLARRPSILQSMASRLRLPSFMNDAAGARPPRPVHAQTLPILPGPYRLQDAQAQASAAGPLAPFRGFAPRSAFNGENGNMQGGARVRALHEILPTLTPTQLKFFDKLDLELDKIENFYLDREKEAQER
jgi:hypothetical protein